MLTSQTSNLDEIGPWSEVKLQIIEKYATAYSKILSRNRLHHVYIDAFAGAGIHVSKTSGNLVPGSPAIALGVEPSFKEYHFIDLDSARAQHLAQLKQKNWRHNVKVYKGDCNPILVEKIFPTISFRKFRRALCLLDPYGLQLDWKVIAKAASMETIEIFLNFPVMHMNRSVLWHSPKLAPASQIPLMDRFWGDDSWRHIAYRPSRQLSLFGTVQEKASNEDIAEAFRQRLIDVAGFAHVPKPLAMRNSRGSIVYYLYFAAHKPVAAGIVEGIFQRYREI